MNKWKVYAILLTIVSFGAVQETHRIFTSAAPDIAENRSELIPMAIIMTGVVIYFAIKFWKKSKRKELQ